jgi:hypothetical protein
MTWCPAPARGQLLRGAAALAVVLTLGACEFPTEAPIFESRFVVPSENTTLTVGQLLPSSITVSGSNFQLALSPVTINRTLGQLCAACVAFNGFTVPYPGFTASVSTTITIPSDVASAVLASGAVSVSIVNSFGFDPLNPPGATTAGNMTVTVVNGSRTLGSTVITGSFPTGTTRTASVPLTAGTISGPIDVTVAITSPPGGTAPSNFVTVNTNGSLSVTASPANILISSANVAVSNKTISVNAIALDLSEIDQSIADRVVSGAIILKMTNPFTVSGTLQLRITGSGVNIVKNVTVAAGTTTQRVEFTGAELRQILGKDVQLSITGPVNATGSSVTVTPGQVLNVETSLDLVVQIGGTVNP